jgi:hypothetical protein
VRYRLPQECCVCCERFDNVDVVPLDDLPRLCRAHFYPPDYDAARPDFNVDRKPSIDYDCLASMRDFSVSQAQFNKALQAWKGLTVFSLWNWELPPFSASAVERSLQRVCKSCVIESLTAAMRLYQTSDDGLRILCPLCPKKSTVSEDDDPRSIEPRKLFDALGGAADDSRVAALTNRYNAEVSRRQNPVAHCPAVDCSFAVPIAKVVDDRIDCPQHGVSCAKCHLLIIGSRPRTRSHALAHRDCTGVAADVRSFAVGADVRRCPNCTALIEKNSGCEVIVCASCMHDFDWIDKGVRITSS